MLTKSFCSKLAVPLSLLLPLAPAVMLLPGCSGGGGTGPGLGITPTPTTGPEISTTVDFGNGQIGVVKFTRTGNNLNGSIDVQNKPVPVKSLQAAAIPFQLATGQYGMTGTTNGTTYTLSGNFGSFGTFTMTGTLPTTTADGTYTLTTNGETVTGTIPKSGVQPTPTVTATATNPPTGGFQAVANLTFSNVSAGSNLPPGNITKFDTLNKGELTTVTLGTDFNQTLVFEAEVGNPNTTGQRRFIQSLSASDLSDPFNPKLRKFFVGQVISGGTFFGANRANITFNTLQGTTFKFGSWDSNGTGTITVTAVGANSITLKYTNVGFVPSPVNGGVGTFTVNGTLQLSGLTVKS